MGLGLLNIVLVVSDPSSEGREVASFLITQRLAQLRFRLRKLGVSGDGIGEKSLVTSGRSAICLTRRCPHATGNPLYAEEEIQNSSAF